MIRLFNIIHYKDLEKNKPKQSLDETVAQLSEPEQGDTSATETLVPGNQTESSIEKPKKDMDEFILTKKKKAKSERYTKDKNRGDEGGRKEKEPASQIADVSQLAPFDTTAPSTAYPATPPPSTITSLLPPQNEAQKDRRRLKIKRRRNGSLLIKYGGRQSQYVRHFDQPNWFLEILTDSQVKYKLKSNRQILQKRLLQAKETWEQNDFERLDRALCHRCKYLLENLVPINYNANQPFNIVDPPSDLYSCLHLEDYDLNGYLNKGFVDLRQQSWKAEKEEKMTAAEKFLVKRRRHHHGKTKPYGMDYFPENLRRKVEKYRMMRAEAEEMEKMLRKPSAMMPAHEKKIYEEIIQPETTPELVTLPEHQSPPLVEQQQQPPLPIAENQQQEGKPEEGRKKKKGDSKSIKKEPSTTLDQIVAEKEEEDNAERLEKALGGGSISKPKKMKPSALSSTKPTDLNKVDNESQPPQLEERVEEFEEEKLRHSGAIGEILKRYEEFFKQPKTIREGLLDVTKRSHLEQGGSKKLVLTRSGISKYCQKLFNNGDDKKSGENLVAEKLLQWAFDYTCLEPSQENRESIEDPGELPAIFMKSIYNDPKMEEELNLQKNEMRYPLPPLKRPTRVLIGPKIRGCECGKQKKNNRKPTQYL